MQIEFRLCQWVPEAQPGGMEKVPLQGHARRGPPIERIRNHRVAGSAEVDAYLVHAA